jgi:hypothetical protein
MNETAEMGFTYDVKVFNSKHEQTDHQIVHNLITDEGKEFFLCNFFSLKQKPIRHPDMWKDITDLTKILTLAFMTNTHTPNETFDFGYSFWQASGAASLVNTFYVNTIKNITSDTFNIDSVQVSGMQAMNKRTWDSSTNTLLLTPTDQYGTDVILTLKPVLLTGCFLLTTDYPNGWSYDAEQTKGTLIIVSEAMFKSPIQMEKGSYIRVEPSFTLISA